MMGDLVPFRTYRDRMAWFELLTRVSASPDTLGAVGKLGEEYTESEARINRIHHRLSSRIGAIIMSAADDAVQDVTAQLTKASGEIDAEVTKLTEAGVSPESLAGLQGIAQRLDDRTPDPEPETPETPAEPETPET